MSYRTFARLHDPASTMAHARRAAMRQRLPIRAARTMHLMPVAIERTMAAAVAATSLIAIAIAAVAAVG